LQRVKEASVSVEGKRVGEIGPGICLLVGVEKKDTEEEARFLARKIGELRIFPDEQGKMNLSVGEVRGEVLAISQFTLAGSVKKGKRPSFDKAEESSLAEPIFLKFVEHIRHFGLKVKTGVFGASMEVSLINDGPVTFILQKRKSLN
jgi:D-tyrosyl-tRNA(Tyr) deacylase